MAAHEEAGKLRPVLDRWAAGLLDVVDPGDALVGSCAIPELQPGERSWLRCAVGLERAHLVGYSMGAGITFKLLVDHPDRLISAMPCGIGLQPPTAEEQELYEARARALEQAGRTGSARDQSDAEAPLNEGLRRFVEFVSQGNDAAALAAVLRTIDEVMPDVSELEHNSVPSLSIFGEHDMVAGIAWTAERMANLDVEIIEGANHFTAVGHPDFVPAIKSFVAQHASSPPNP